MIITKEILDELTAKAKENPRLRCNLDMRNSEKHGDRKIMVKGSGFMVTYGSWFKGNGSWFTEI